MSSRKISGRRSGFPVEKSDFLILRAIRRFRTPWAGLDTQATDELADKPFAPEFFQFLIASEVIEVPGFVFDRVRRTRNPTAPAFAAAVGKRLGEIQRHGGQNTHETNLGAVLWIHQKVVSADPPQARQHGDRFMGDMAALAPPIDHLRGGDGQGLVIQILDT